MPLNEEQMQAWTDFVIEAERARYTEVQMRWDMGVIIALAAFTLGFILGPGVLW